MIKIKWIAGRTAQRSPGESWKSEDKKFEKSLNMLASADQIEGYVPDIEAAIVELVKDNYPGAEVEYTASEPSNIPEDAKFEFTETGKQ